MPHPLVLQLRFTRGEFVRALEGLSDADARQRIVPMNCISWNIGHLAWQEQRYWLTTIHGITPLPEVNKQFGYGRPASTPPLDESWQAWRTITAASDPVLDAITTEQLQRPVAVKGWSDSLTPGSLMLRVIYHYWYHTGECMAIRQSLGHTGLAEFIGDIDNQAPYRPE